MIIISLFGMIPLVGGLLGFLISILSLILFYYSLKEVHELDTWKVIVILVVIPILILGLVIGAAVFWYTGVFNPAKFNGGGSGTVGGNYPSGFTRLNQCGGFGSFTCIDQAVSQSGFVQIVLGNALGRSITINSASISGLDAPKGCSVANSVIAPNGKITINCPSSNLVSGDIYDWTVTVNYVDSQSGLTKTDAGGFIRGKVS